MTHIIKMGVTSDAELKAQIEQRMFDLVQARRTSTELFDAKLREFTSSAVVPIWHGTEEIPEDMLFLDFLRAWLPTTRRQKKPVSENTYIGYNNIIEGRAADYFGTMFPYRLSQLTPDVFEDYYDWLRGLGRTDCTIPVSYTHLDVYKRQRRYRPGPKSCSPNTGDNTPPWATHFWRICRD